MSYVTSKRRGDGDSKRRSVCLLILVLSKMPHAQHSGRSTFYSALRKGVGALTVPVWGR